MGTFHIFKVGGSRIQGRRKKGERKMSRKRKGGGIGESKGKEKGMEKVKEGVEAMKGCIYLQSGRGRE